MTPITIKTSVNKPLELVWECWTQPKHIVNWNFASDDWCCPTAENDLRPGGQYSWRMEARDGSMGFDFGGTHNEVAPNSRISSALDDGRKVIVEFSFADGVSTVVETFEPESSNPLDMQRAGWQAILDNFAKYTEGVEAQ